MNKHVALIALAVVAAGSAISSVAHGQSIPLSEVSHIHGVGFDAANPGSIFLATHNGVFRANPDGTAEAISSERNDYMGFTPDPADSGRLLASGHPEGGGNMGVLLSEDGGVTWAQIAPGVGGPVDFHAMTISPADPGTVYGLYGDIQLSRDGGETWSIAGPSPGQVIDLAASPSDADVVYAGTVEGLMRSADAGKTWTLIGPANVAASMAEAASDGSVYAYFAGAGLFKLSATDGKWAELSNAFGEGYILHLAADPTDPAHLVAVTDASAVMESADGGKTWEPFGQ